MTELTLTDRNNVKLDYGVASPGHLSLTRGYNGFYVDLDQRQRRELALTILAQDFDIAYPQGPAGEIVLMAKRAEAFIGEYYQVLPDSTLEEPWRSSPIVKVTDIRMSGRLVVSTVDGESITWSKTLRGLRGPLKVTEQTEWIVEEG